MPAHPSLQRHLPFLLAGVAVPVLAGLLEVVDGRWIRFWFLPELVFPDVCLSRRWFDLGCPACGLTRSIVYLVHGRVAESLAVHRLGWLVFALIVAQVPYRAWRLAGNDHRLQVPQRLETAVWLGLACLLIANRIYSLAGGD